MLETTPSRAYYVGGSGRRQVTTVYTLRCRVGDGLPSTAVRAKFISAATGWIKNGHPNVRIPKEAFEGGASFEYEEPGYSVEAISLEAPSSWTLHFQHPDRAVPARTWTTELGLLQDARGNHFHLSLQCASPPDCEEDVPLTRPRLVGTYAKILGLHGVWPITDSPQLDPEQPDLMELESVLTAPGRELPVVVMTEAAYGRQRELNVSEYVLDPELVARKLLGLAYVTTLPKESTYEWSDRVGRNWSAFNGAVRIYQPGLSLEHGSPYQHPLVTADVIAYYQYNGMNGERAFLEALQHRLMAESGRRRTSASFCMNITDARRHALQAKRDAHVDSEELLNAYLHDLEKLQSDLTVARDGENTALTMAQDIEDELAYYREENRKLRVKVNALLALPGRPTESAPAEQKLPENYAEIEDWAEATLHGLKLTGKAVRGLKSAEYSDVQLVCRSLLLLSSDYVSLRQGRLTKETFDNALRELGLELSPSITKSRAGEQGDEYHTVYPPGTNQKRFLDLHLKKGADREPKNCLRIYFFYDDTDEVAVVGWLTSHLTTRKT